MVAMDQISVADVICPLSLARGLVRVHLPFSVDMQALSQQLLREGYPLAHQPDTPDTQGWGPDFDPNGYYPHWVFPDPTHEERSVFAFYPQPEDVSQANADQRMAALHLGDRSQELIRRWVPVLAAVQTKAHSRA
jgi:hypothetical protein